MWMYLFQQVEGLKLDPIRPEEKRGDSMVTNPKKKLTQFYMNMNLIKSETNSSDERLWEPCVRR